MESNVSTIDDLQASAWRLVSKKLPYNAETAITRRWLQLKAEGQLIGVPIGPERDIERDGRTGKAQAFTSGAVLAWMDGAADATLE